MMSAGSCASVALLLALTIPVRGQPQAAPPTQPPAPAASRPAPPPQFEKGLFDLRVGSLLTESDVGLVNDRGVILIPVDRLLTLTGLAAISSTDSTRTIPAYGSTTAAVLDIPNHIIRRLGQKYPIADDEATLLLGTWYLASDRVAELLGAHVVADLSSLLVFVSREPPFPSEQLQASRECRAAYGVGLETPDDRMEGATFLRETGGLTADWSLSSSATRYSQDYGLQMALGMAVLGGSLSASSAATKNGLDTRVLRSSWQYTYANPANDWLRSVQLGNAAAATSGRAIEGIALSNTHLFHSGPFSVTRIAPNVPPGWSYEVYQNGQLVGFSDANTRTPVAVRLSYGSTPVEIRFHGPAGEEIKSTYVYQIDIDRLSPGRIEYGAGVGKCPLVAGCSVAYGNVAAGLTQWLTASGGVESIDSTVHHVDPYARLIIATASGWKANTEWTPTLRHARFTYFGPGAIAASIDGGRIAAVGPEASITSAAGDRNYVEPEATFSIPHGLGIPASLRLESRAERLVADGRMGGRVGSVLSIGRMQGMLEYRNELTGDGPMISTGGLWFAPPSWSRFGQPTMSGSVGEVHGRLDVIDLAPTWNTSGRGSVSAHLGWSHSTHGVSLSLTYNAFTGRLRESVGMSSSPHQPASTNVVVGSLGMYDPVFGFTSSDRVSPNAAGISGRAFYDEDGDGKFGPGDRPAPTVIVQAAGQSSSADDLGRYRIPGILPYEPVRVSVDTVDGIDPSYVPAVASLDVRLSPNAMTRVDIPLLKTREAAGAIKADSLVPTIGGVTIELRDTRTDKVVYTTPTFADGTFYMGRIVPGKYRVVVSRRSLTALGAVAQGDGIEINVEPKGDAPVMIPTIRLFGGAQRDPSSP
jgi:hypothetical protein